MKNHVMLDIETLGTTPGSVVLSVAAVAFDPYGKIGIEVEDGKPELTEDGAWYGVIDLASSQKAGLTIDADTLAWWQKQEDAVRWEAFGLAMGKSISFGEVGSLDDTVDSLCTFFNEVQLGVYDLAIRKSGQETELYVWSHGAAFDIPLLEACFDRSGCDVPWQFRNVRDTRTVIDLCKPNLARDGLPWHHPLWDAVHQVRQMQTSLGWIAEATGQTVRLDSTRQ